MTHTYLGTADIAELLDVDRRTINKWLARHPDCPEPDVLVGATRPVPGWLPERAQAWRDWHTARQQGHDD